MPTYETRGVLAGAYKGGRKKLDSTLTHVLEVFDAAPYEADHSVCKRIPSEHLCDVSIHTPPTCPRCLKFYQKLHMQRSPSRPVHVVVQNRTGWNTHDLQRLFEHGARALGCKKSKVVRVLPKPEHMAEGKERALLERELSQTSMSPVGCYGYRRSEHSIDDHSRGIAYVGSCDIHGKPAGGPCETSEIVLFLPPPNKITMRRLARLFQHEVLHTLGKEHGPVEQGQSPTSPRHMTKAEYWSLGPVPQWAKGIKLRYGNRQSALAPRRKRLQSTSTKGPYGVQFQMPGSPWVWVKGGGAGSTTNADEAHDFGDSEIAADYAKSMTRPGSSLNARAAGIPRRSSGSPAYERLCPQCGRPNGKGHHPECPNRPRTKTEFLREMGQMPDEGNVAMDDALSVYLAPPGRAPGIGPERGRMVAHGIARYTSPHGSSRYVYYKTTIPVAALQVVSRDGKHATIANVYTKPEARRQGLAAQLLHRARRDFKSVAHASEENISEVGKHWRDKVGSPVPDATIVQNVMKEAVKFELAAVGGPIPPKHRATVGVPTQPGVTITIQGDNNFSLGWVRYEGPLGRWTAPLTKGVFVGKAKLSKALYSPVKRANVQGPIGVRWKFDADGGVLGFVGQSLYFIDSRNGVMPGRPCALFVLRHGKRHSLGYYRSVRDAQETALHHHQGKSLQQGSPVKPTASELAGLVRSFAVYLSTQEGANIKVQQRAYDSYARKFDRLQKKYPQVDFTSQTTQDSLLHAAKKLLSQKLFRGPGSTF